MRQKQKGRSAANKESGMCQSARPEGQKPECWSPA